MTALQFGTFRAASSPVASAVAGSFASAVATLAAICLSAAPVRAQTARGVVHDAANTPIAGAVVTLLDSANNSLSRMLTDERGEFRMVTSQPGTYRLQAQRIGYQPLTSAPLMLASGATVAQTLVLSGARTVLATVKVNGKNSCGKALEGDVEVFDVWQQALASLQASAVTSSTRGLTTSLMEVNRVLDPKGKVIDQGLRMRTDNVVQPWRALHPDTLRKRGYTWLGRDDALTYNAPGIDAIISPAFQADHCFKIAQSKDASEIGLAFEPAPERFRIADLKGVIWLSRADAQLRRAEFTFGKIPGMPEVPYPAGGSMHFSRLPSGGVVIDQWELLMPVLEKDNRMGSTDVRVAQVQSTGGLLVAVRRGADTVFKRPSVTVTGVVRDSVSNRPIGGAVVRLSGTDVQVAAAADGQFAIADVLPGQYTATVTTPALDSLGAASGSSVLIRDSIAPLVLRVPPAMSVAQALCGGSFAADKTRGAIMGSVTTTDATGGAANFIVAADWNDGQGKRLETRTDARGGYRLCAVPLNAALTMRVIATKGRADPRPVQLSANQRIAVVQLAVDASRAAVATFAGRVVSDSGGAPVADAVVSVEGMERTVRTNADGLFRLDEVPVGVQRVAVRKLGYGEFSNPVEFEPNDEAERRLVLLRTRVLDSVVTIADAKPIRLVEFEEHRKMGLGWFLGRAELEKLDGQSTRHALMNARDMNFIGGRYPIFSRASFFRQTHDDGSCRPPMTLTPRITELASMYVCGCFPVVFLDGSMQTGSIASQPFDLLSINVNQLEAIEWYATNATLPAQFDRVNTPCGVLVLHTRQPGRKGEKTKGLIDR